jgi:putative ABC transport system permease protein
MALPNHIRSAFRIRRKVKDQVADDVDAEIRFHLESRTEELMAQGRNRREAERRAMEEFGDMPGAKRRLRAESARSLRSVRRLEWLAELRQDARYGVRKLASQPVFAAVAVLTLALGIGANSAIFSVVHAVLLKPLPYSEPDQLVSIWEVAPTGDNHNVVSRGNFMDWRDQALSFETLGAYGSSGGVTFYPDNGAPTRVRVSFLTPGVFRALGVSATAGRTFTPEEGVPGNDAVVVLSHRFAQNQFGVGDVVGEAITLDGDRYSVVGVMPPSFDFPQPDVDVWAPWALDEEDRQNRRSHNLMVIGRLKPGQTLERAQAELDALAAGITELYPEHMTGWGVNVQPFRADLVASTRPLLLLLLGVVGLVLLLACANLANLLLARAVARQREVAIRGALGARRGRLVRQFLTEAGLLAVLGGGLGLAITAVGLDAFVALAPDDIPLLDDTRVDPVILGFAAGATLLATLIFGLLPALRVTGADLENTLRASGARAGTAHTRVRSGILAAEVALAVVLLIGAGLLLRSFLQLQQQDYGFDRENVMTATLDLPFARYSDGTVDHVEFYEALLARVASIPGAISAAGSTDLPAGFGSMTFSFAIEGRPRPGPRPREEPQPLRIVTPDYFHTLRIPLVEGRFFTPYDDETAPDVLIINESLARVHWPDESPVGKRVSFEGQEGPWLEIVGVVGDTRHYAVDAMPSPALYMPHAQKRWDWTSWLNVIVRTDGDPVALAPSFRAALWELDDQLVPGRIASLTDLYAETNARRRFAGILLVVFAGLALILGTIGVYGVLSYTVAQRAREFGVRIALGAPRGAVAALVIRQGGRLAMTGIALGIGAAFWLSRFLESLVYGISTTNVGVFVGVPLLILVTAGLAAYQPARRATRVDPVQALRAE